MKTLLRAMWAFNGCVLALAAIGWADTKVEVKKTHVCCPDCEKAVGKILKESGVKGSAEKGEGRITFSAGDDKAAQKVLDALAAGGFHGDTGNRDLKIKDDSGVKEGKVTSLTLQGAHNCCPQCNNAIKEAIKKVDGVESNDVKPRAASFTVKGNFDGAKLVKALNDAGFHATSEKPKGKDKDESKDKEKDKEKEKDK